jgi:dCTP deaminase
MSNIASPGQGIFPKDGLKSLISAGRIQTLKNFTESHVGPASIDITTTGEVYRVERVLQPNPRNNETVRNILPWMNATRIQIGDVLEVGVSYLAKASIDVNLPPGMYAFFNAKSTSGRNFLFVRTLADQMFMFDSADRRNAGYSGEIWLVIEPLSFPVVLTEKECYNQGRVFNADTRFSQKHLDDLLIEHDILFRRDQTPYPQGKLSHFTHDGSVLSTLHARDGLVGYRAKHSTKPLDLSARGLNPCDYFEPVYAEQLKEGEEHSWGVSIDAGWYYLLSTEEMFKVPDHHTAELIALDRRLGDIFTHFAGFFDPGFFGTATLEIYSPRKVFLRHGQPFARFVFEKCRSDAPSYATGHNYQGQVGTKLPKQFFDWK